MIRRFLIELGLAGMAAPDQPDSVEVDRLPIVSVDLEREVLFVACAVSHYRPTWKIELGDPLPEQLADTRGNMSDEDSRTDFQQPAG